MGELEKEGLKALWKRSKISFLLAGVSILKLAILSKLKLGNNILSALRKKFEARVSTPYTPTKVELVELEWFAKFATDIFKFDNANVLKKYYPTYVNHVVGEVRTCRFAIVRKGSNVYVSVRGSSTMDNWVDGFTIEVTRDRSLRADVHKGYNLVAVDMVIELRQWIGFTDTVYVTGGSMGGAVATLLGWHLDNEGYNVQKVWAFANPRVSEDDYGHLNVVNVLNLKDPAVYLPAFSLFTKYRHQGDTLAYSNGQWRWYRDSWETDLLTSMLFISEDVKLEEHLAYGARLMELKQTLTAQQP